jgi:hypothetical protein
MIPSAERPSLREFLASTPIRTGERLEAAALAEMAGYTVADAQADGWPDVLRASLVSPITVDRVGEPEGTRQQHPGLRAFGRGLVYTAPVLALAGLFPPALNRPELWFLAVVVVLSWGGSMACNHVVGTWCWGDPAVAWRRAVVVAACAVAATVGVSWWLLRGGWITPPVALVGIVQAAYFFTAGPLLLRPERWGMAVIAGVGAAAGLPLVLARVSVVDLPGEAVAMARAVAAASLVAPAVLLVRHAARSRRSGTGRAVAVVHRDTVAFGAYGASFGCLVLWAPVVVPGSALTMLMLVVVAGICFAELTVALVHQRAGRLLDRDYAPATFPRRARRIVVGGAVAYTVPLGAILLVVVRVGEAGGWAPVPIGAVFAVWLLGLVQMLSLIGMSVHGIRPVSRAVTCGAVGLLAATAALDGAEMLVLAFGLALGVIAAWLLGCVLRLCVHPINLL